MGTGLKGVESASYAMFKKSCDELSQEEALTIAAMLVYPKPRVANADWSAKIRRRAGYAEASSGPVKSVFRRSVVE